MKNIRIAIADDHNLFRKGLRSMIEDFENMKLVIEAPNGKELMDQMEGRRIDVVLLDIRMPEMDGYETASRLKAMYPKVKIIVISMMNDEKNILRLIEMGVNGYLFKNADIDELEKAIRIVMQNDYYFNDRVAKSLTSRLAQKTQRRKSIQEKTDLSEREWEVLKLICLEFNNDEIAKKMYLSKRTIEGYKHRIMAKTGARSLVGMIKFALRSEIIPGEF